MITTLFVAINNISLRKTLSETRTDLENKEMIINKDHDSFYFKENSDRKDYYIITQCRMKKLSINEFVNLRENYGYK